MENKIFIKGNVPSSKNSKQFIKTKTGRTCLINSKTVQKYLAEFEYQYFDNKNRKKFKEMAEGKEKPLEIRFTFYRDSKRKFDANNISQIVQDLMKKHNWIQDDNYDEMIPVFNKDYFIDRENPGVIIEVL